MARKQHGFVREYLERVSWKVLEKHRPVIRSMIRGHAGVYALYRGDKLYYVGLATNLMSRVNHHLRDRHQGKWDRFSVYLTVDDGHIRPIESLILRVINPSGNRVKGRLATAVDLVRSLKRQIEERVKDETANLLGGRFALRRRRSKSRSAKGLKGLAGVADKRMNLLAVHKGKKYKATLGRDGRITYRGRHYDSPSAAAKYILGRNANGWHFWRYRDPQGIWVRLREMKR